jgi:hypothetical protein
MRKATMCLLVALCLWGATSWQSQPQWRVVVVKQVTHTNTTFNNDPMFTPSKTGLYRLSGYCSVDGELSGEWNFEFGWTDFAGQTETGSRDCTAIPQRQGTQVFIFSPMIGTPVYLSSSSVSGNATYNAAFTIEQLQ